MMTSNFISGTTKHYAYNGQGWLTRAKYIDTASGTEAFTYDATGNRTNRTWTPSIGFPVTSTNFTMAPHSDLVTQAGTIGTMDYSVGGNLIDDNWIGREYEWDQFNRVTMVKSATGTPLYGFEYGGTGERTVQNTYSGGLVSYTRAFLYDREDVIAEFSNDTFATLFRRYIHGPGIDEPLAILGDDVGEYTYYLHDGLGSVTGVVDENGKLGAIDYLAFGETRSNTVKIENRYRYTSREFVETNLYYYRARHMRPDLGRFISMDPLKTIDGTNMFGYVGNDPVDWIDTDGKSIEEWKKNNPGREPPPPVTWPPEPPEAPPGNGGLYCWIKKLTYWRNKTGNDKYRHCMAFCEIAEECGKYQLGWAIPAGLLRELRQLIHHRDPHDSKCDLLVNELGSMCGMNGRNCNECCIDVQLSMPKFCCE